MAEELRRRGHDVVAVAADHELKAMTDAELLGAAGPDGPLAVRDRRIVTENVKDFRPLLRRAEELGQPTAGVLFTSSRRVPRSRLNPTPLSSLPSMPGSGNRTQLDGRRRTGSGRSRSAAG